MASSAALLDDIKAIASSFGNLLALEILAIIILIYLDIARAPRRRESRVGDFKGPVADHFGEARTG